MVAEVAGPRDVCQAVLSHISERCLATALRVSSSITTGHCVLNKGADLKRLGSENNAMKEAQRPHTRNDTAGIVLQQHLH